MYGQFSTLAFVGIEARAVLVDVRTAARKPVFSIVGQSDTSIAESRQWVRNALLSVDWSRNRAVQGMC